MSYSDDAVFMLYHQDMTSVVEFFLPLDEAVVSRAVFVSVSGMGGNTFGAS